VGVGVPETNTGAGVPAWKRPFRVFRSSCVTDWAKVHPSHAVASWAGHTVAVAGRHYLTITDADFQRATEQGATPRVQAAQKAAQQVQELSCNDVNAVHHLQQKPTEFPENSASYAIVPKSVQKDIYPAWIRTRNEGTKIPSVTNYTTG
jgi:hypothetical protein